MNDIIPKKTAKVKTQIDGARCRTPFPHVVLKLPESIHTYGVKSDREAVYLQYPPELTGKMREAGLLDTPRIFPVAVTIEVRSLLLKLREELDNLPVSGTADRIDLFALLLWEELLKQDAGGEKNLREMAGKIDRIATFFHLHFADDFDLDRLLRNNGLSRRTFLRYWQRFHRTPPAEYVKELKLRHAKMLLEESPLSIYEIARKVNFRHSNYLCRVFRERFGVTPLQFRSNVKVERNPSGTAGRP